MAKSAYLEVNSGVSDFKQKYEEIAAAKTLTAADSGKVFGINQASAYEITLPLAATAGIGWHCKFVLSTAASNAVTIANNTAEIQSLVWLQELTMVQLVTQQNLQLMKSYLSVVQH